MIQKKNLKQGNIIEIFLHWKEMRTSRGNAVLLERLADKEPPKSQKKYILREYASMNKGVNEIKSIYCSYERWIVRFIDGPYKNFKTAVNIAYRLKQNSNDNNS